MCDSRAKVSAVARSARYGPCTCRLLSGSLVSHALELTTMLVMVGPACSSCSIRTTAQRTSRGTTARRQRPIAHQGRTLSPRSAVVRTCGTTARPKGVVRDNGGHAVALRWSMDNIYDTRAGEVFWAASDVGWVVGHSYIVYAPQN